MIRKLRRVAFLKATTRSETHNSTVLQFRPFPNTPIAICGRCLHTEGPAPESLQCGDLGPIVRAPSKGRLPKGSRPPMTATGKTRRSEGNGFSHRFLRPDPRD